ncbi:hypothetical protein I4U23_007717 [Adineta vaga]|nr:hypothetical protein I4U23_007717 [Adineta vaga]
MANRVSASYSRNNPNQNTSSSNNRSSRSTLTTHTYASTNTCNTEPTYTTTRIEGDPRTLHSYYLTSSNYRPPSTSPVNSLTRRYHHHHHHEYEPSYPSISRYRTPSSSSPYRKTHYLDDSDEEIINEEILEITDLNHYPTLIERWGDDTKTVVRQEGELKIEDFVEFEETEPTVIEEILYELVYSGDNLKTCRQIHRSRSESRNFRKIKKRRTKRKLQPNDDSSYITSQATSRDTSGTRSPYFNDSQYSPERSSTPTQSILSTSWQSTGFTSTNRSSLEIPLQNRSNENNYINRVKVNENQTFPRTTITNNNNIQYETFETDAIDKQKIDLVDEMRYISNQIDTLITADDDALIENDKYAPIISEKQGITKIKLAPTTSDQTTDDSLLNKHSNDTSELLPSQGNDQFITTSRAIDDKEQSRINIIEQTSLPKEISRQQIYSIDNEKQINNTISTKHDESEKEDDEQSSTTGPTVQELDKDEHITGKDTDEDASFSESEQISSQSIKSDTPQQSDHVIQPTTTTTATIIDELRPSPLPSIELLEDEKKTIAETTDLLISELDDIEAQLKSIESEEQQLETMLDQNETEDISTSEDQTTSAGTVPSITPEKAILSVTIDDEHDTEEDLRPFLNSLTAHLMPELPRSFEDETEDELSFMSETKSSEEPISQEDQVLNSGVQQTKEKTSTQSHQHIPSEQIEAKTQDQLPKDQTIVHVQETEQEQEQKENSSSIIDTSASTVSYVQETSLHKQEPTTKEISHSIDSSVHSAEQIITTDKTPQDRKEQEPISLTSSNQLQSKEITSEEIQEVTEEQSDNVKSLTDIVRQINTQPSNQVEDKLSSLDSNVERTQSVNTSEEQKQSISNTSSTTDETIERRTSIDRQPTTEFKSTKASDEHIPSDSLVDVVRQIRAIPQITRLPFTDNRPETADLIEQKLEKPSVDYHVDIIETNESIPYEPVTIPEEHVLSTTDKRRSITETMSTPISENTEQETQAERLSTEAPLTTQSPSIDTTIESIVSIEKQNEKQPLIKSFDENINNNTDRQQLLPGQQSTQTSDLSIIKKHVTDELVTDVIPISTQFIEQTTRDKHQSSIQDKINEDVAERLSTVAVTEAVDELLTRPSVAEKPIDETNTDIAYVTDSTIKSEALSSPFTSTITAEKQTLQESDEAEITIDNEDQTKTNIATDVELKDSEIIEQKTSISTTDVQPLSSDIEKDVNRTEVRRLSKTSPSTELIEEASSKKTTGEVTAEKPSYDQTTTTTTTIQDTDSHRDEVEPFRESTAVVKNVEDHISKYHEPTDNESIAQHLSPEALTSTDEKIDSTSLVLQPALTRSEEIEHPYETPSTISPNQTDTPSKQTNVDLTETITTITTTDRRPSEEDDAQDIEAERLSTEALTDAVRKIISSSSPTYPPSTALETTKTSEPKEKDAEYQDETLSTLSPKDTNEESKETVYSSTSISEEQKPEGTSSITETITTATPTDRRPSEEDDAQKVEAENLSREALTDAVREIISSSSPTYPPSAESETETKTSITMDKQAEHRDETPLTQSPNGTDQQSKETTIDKSETVTKTTSTDRRQSLKDDAQESEAERLSTEALTDAVRKIISSSSPTYPPPVETETEKVSKSTEKEAENLSTDALTNAVREILASPRSAYPPSTESEIGTETSIPTDKEAEHQDETPLSLSPNQTTEELKEITDLSTSVTEERKPEITIDKTETVTVTSSTDRRPSDKEDNQQIEAEHLSTEALTDAVDEILVSSLLAHRPPVEAETLKTTVISEKEAEHLSTEALTDAVREILTSQQVRHPPGNALEIEKKTTSTEKADENDEESLSSTSTTQTNAPSNETTSLSTSMNEEQQQPEGTSTINEAVTTTTTETDRRPSDKDDAQEVEAERLSTEALTDTVRKIISSSSPIHPPSVEPETENVSKGIEKQTENLSTEALTDAVRKIISSSSPTYPPSIEPETEKVSKSTEKEAENLSREALTDAVREIISSSSPTYPPSAESETETKTSITMDKQAEHQDETPLTQSPNGTDQQSKETTIDKSETVTKTTSTDRRQSLKDDAQESEAERLSTEALTDAVRKIISSSSPTYSPSVEPETEKVSKSTEQESENLSTDALTDAVRDILASPRSAYPPSTESEIGTETSIPTDKETEHQDETPSNISLNETNEELKKTTSLPTSMNEEQKPEGISSITETITTATSTDRRSSYKDDAQESEAERLSTEALTDAVRKIISSSSPTYPPSIEPVNENAFKSTEKEADNLSTDALTNAVREILSTPNNIRCTTPVLMKREHQDDTSSVDAHLQTVETTTTKSSSEDHRSSMDEREKEVEAEPLSSEALVEAVREIRATPLKVQPSTKESIEDHEEAAYEPRSSVFEQIITTSPLLETEKSQRDRQSEDKDVSSEVLADTVQETPIISSALHPVLLDSKAEKITDQIELQTPTSEQQLQEKDEEKSPKEATIEENQAIQEEETKEIEAERLSTEVLTNAVPEIISKSLDIHHPSVDSIVQETTTTVLEQSEKASALSTIPILDEIKVTTDKTISLDESTVSDIKSEDSLTVESTPDEQIVSEKTTEDEAPIKTIEPVSTSNESVVQKTGTQETHEELSTQLPETKEQVDSSLREQTPIDHHFQDSRTVVDVQEDQDHIDSTLQQTAEQYQHVPVAENIEEELAERISTDVIVDAVEQILTTSIKQEFDSENAKQDAMSTSSPTTTTNTEAIIEDHKPTPVDTTEETMAEQSLSTSSSKAVEDIAIHPEQQSTSLDVHEKSSVISEKSSMEHDEATTSVAEKSAEEDKKPIEAVLEKTVDETLSTEYPTDIVHHALTTPLNDHVPSVTAVSEEKIEQPSIESLQSSSKQVISTVIPSITITEEEEEEPEEEQQQQQITDTDIQQPKLELTTKTISEEDETQENEAERLSSHALTEAVEEIHSTTEEKPLQREELPEIQKSDAIVLTPDATTTISFEDHRTFPDDVSNQVKVEDLSSDALTQVVQEMLAKPLIAHHPTVDSSIQKTTVINEDKVEKQSSSESLTSTLEQQSDIASNEVEQLSKETLIEETTQATTPELLQQSSQNDKSRETEAENLSSQVLTEIVHENLATSLNADRPSVHETTVNSNEIERQNEAPSIDSLVRIAQHIKDTMPQEVVITKDQVSDEAAKEAKTDQLTSESLTEAMHEILSTPINVTQPSVDSIVEKTTTTATTIEEEIPSTPGQEVQQQIQQKDSQENKLTSEDLSLLNEQKKIEVIAEHLSSEALTQAVREVLAIPPVQTLTVSLPSIDAETQNTVSNDQQNTDDIIEDKTIVESQLSSSITKETREEEEVLPIDALTETVRQILVSPASVQHSTELTPLSDEAKKEATIQSIIIPSEEVTTVLISSTPTKEVKSATDLSPINETKQEVTSEDRQPSLEKVPEEVEAERLSIDALTETVRLILATPLTIHLPSTDIKIKSGDAVEETTVESEVPITEDKETQKEHEVVARLETSESTVPSSTTEVDITASTEKNITDVHEEEKPSSDSLSEITRQILASHLKTEEAPVHSQRNEYFEEDSLASKLIPEQETVSTELQVPHHSDVSSISTTNSGDEPLHDIDSQSISSSFNTIADDVITKAISNAHHLLGQSIEPSSSTEDIIHKIDSNKTTTNDKEEESYDDYHSTSGLTNIVNTILNVPNQIFPEVSVPYEENKNIVTPKSDFGEKVNTNELNNIIDTATKILNSPVYTPEQSDTSEDVSLQRASADQDTTNDVNEPLTFFVPQISTISEKNFRELYEQRHFVSPIDDDDDLTTEFAPLDRQESMQSTTSIDEKKLIPTSPLAYYELQEQRHTLMSPQQSVTSEKNETSAPSLTTWTTVQSRIDYETPEKKQETSDIQLDDQAYELARRFDLESPSIISNLPIREYRQVFGIPDDIVNTVDDMTYHIDRVLSIESKDNQQSITTDDVKSRLSESSEESDLVEISSLPSTKDVPVSDNIKRITEALYALESDLIEQEVNLPKQQEQQSQSSVSKTVEGLISELDHIESDLRSTALTNDFRETLEHQSIGFPSKDERTDDSVSLRTTEQERSSEHKNENKASSPNIESISRYSTLLDHIDNLEKSLLDLQPSSSVANEEEKITSETDDKNEDNRQLHHRYDTLLDHVNRLEEAINEDLSLETKHSDKQNDVPEVEKPVENNIYVDNLSQTMEQILATPMRTVMNPYEKLAHEQSTVEPGLESVLEQVLAATQYPTAYTKLSPPVDTIESVEKQKETQNIETTDETVPSTTTDEEVILTEEKDSSNLVDKAKSLVAEVISSIASTLPSSTYEETIPAEIPASVTEETSTTTTITQSTPIETDKDTVIVTSSEETKPIEDIEQEHVSSTGLVDIMKKFVMTPKEKSAIIEKTTATEELIVYADTQSTPNITEEEDDDADGELSSEEPIIQEEDTSSLSERATSMVADILSSVASILPTFKSSEEIISSDNKVLSDKQDVSTADSTLLDETIPSAIVTNEEKSDITITSVSDQNLPSDTSLNSTKTSAEEPISSFVPAYFTSNDVYYAYKQPAIEQKDELSLVEKATAIVKDIISGITDVLPTTTETTEESTIAHEDHLISPVSKEENAITTAQHILPSIFASNDDVHEQKTPLEGDERDKPESQVQRTVSETQEHHDTDDFIDETVSNIKETVSNLALSKDESIASEISADQPFGTDKNIEEISTEEQQPTVITKNISSDSVKNIETHDDVDSIVEEISNDESDQLDTFSDITSVSEEVKPHYQHQARLLQSLQVVNDEYPWYASYYTIADADANMGPLQFEPEPHEIVTTPEYDRQALVDTRDTREKVHELAQMSTKHSRSNTIEETEAKDDDDGEFQIIKSRKHTPSSITHPKTPSPSTTPKNKSTVSSDNEQKSAVLQDRVDVSTTASSNIPETTTTTTSSKKKHKKQKKDKKDTAVLDTSVPSTPDADEQKLELAPSPLQVERTESVEPKHKSSSVTTDSLQIEQQQKTVDSSKQKSFDERSEEQQAEPISSSINFELEELKLLDDEKNDSTSSDASQWSTSSFIMISDDQAIDSQTSEKCAGIEIITTISSPTHESIKSEVTAGSSPSTKKKKIKQKQESSQKEISQQSKSPLTPVILEAPKVESKPPLPTASKTAPIVRTKIIASSKEEEEIDDDEGFQVVSYRKRVASVTGPEKAPSSSSASTPATPPSKHRFTSATDLRSGVIPNRQSSSIPILTPIIPKQKKDKEETLSSTDADIISSSSIDTHRSTQRDQQKKIDALVQPKSLFSTLLTSSSSPSTSTEEKFNQQQQQQAKDQETISQTQTLPLSISTAETSKVQPKTVSPSHTKSTVKTTLRAKASTSPEEDDDEDDEGFQVVRHRKRILSTPRSDKTLPPAPTTSSYRQNLGRNIDLKPVVIRGRHGSGSGSGSRSIPRSNASGHISSNKRLQNRPKRDRPQMLPLSNSASSVLNEKQTVPLSIYMPDKQNNRQLIDIPVQSSVTEQTWKPVEQIPWTTAEIQQPSKTNFSDIIPLSMQSTLMDQNQSDQKLNANTLQSGAISSSSVEKSSKQKVTERQVSTKTEVQASPAKETISSSSTKISTTETQKSTIVDESNEDDDGFRVVRYRKHASSAVTTPTFPKQLTFDSDPDKRPSKMSRKQHSLPSTPASTPTSIQTMIFKRTPPKPKRNNGL